MQPAVFHKLLTSAIQQNASDIHLQVGHPPLFRVNGELLEVKYHPLSQEDTRAVVDEIIASSYQEVDLAAAAEIDLSYSLEGHGRFRVNIFRQRGSFGVVLRIIPIAIPSFSELNLPMIFEPISSLPGGLVLVVGPTGHGKSTALASMVEYVNNSRRAHIVTIEDPIEFLFRNKKSVISQREVGTDTRSYADATVAALRQDPDVIFIGEIRDATTIDAALKAAETGHLVLSSLHTPTVAKALERLFSFYPPNLDGVLRSRLADCLAAVVALRLLPCKGLPGRIPAVEVLRVTRTIQDCIQDPARTGEIPSHMAEGTEMYGTQTLDQHLIELIQQDRIDLKAAKGAAIDPDAIDRALMTNE